MMSTRRPCDGVWSGREARFADSHGRWRGHAGERTKAGEITVAMNANRRAPSAKLLAYEKTADCARVSARDRRDGAAETQRYARDSMERHPLQPRVMQSKTGTDKVFSSPRKPVLSQRSIR